MDGSKRTGLIATLVFLGLNRIALEADADPLFELVDGVAAGAVAKADVAVFLGGNAGRRRGR